jgi:hypothetical protein
MTSSAEVGEMSMCLTRSIRMSAISFGDSVDQLRYQRVSTNLSHEVSWPRQRKESSPI